MFKIISVLICGCALLGCGSNVFRAVEKHDPADRALALLDEKKADEAISVLNDALEENSEDWVLVSLMASAKAQKAGVDTTEVAIKMATQDESQTAAASNPLTSLFTVLPAATEKV